ncbi:SusC/RagA family TonB-linked outer membrane protein [Pedobacter sp. L105]|uniref:SusC/RagA family TonB-linked outer membrane protein n=1 Tax=Pedobacter sp. L105 TaxID=1641871 RepID=UPI00131BC06C|nr:SusC/RagA family TonB-linked outer membrane protein [Pedobacter sp. L105]
MKKTLLSCFCFLLFIMQSYAQTTTITGTVSAKEDGLPIPGVSVKLKGSKVGSVTGADGKFFIKVSESGPKTLVFSSISYATIERTVTSQGVVNVVLNSTANQLGEVQVVGALGITRTRNQQSYAAQEVKGDEVSKGRTGNFVTELAGRVAGLEIKQSGGIGGSTNAVIRGNKSLFSSNQALFVVDGVPFNNDPINTSGQHSGTGGYDYGSPASDINPDDIESVTVLKGPAGAALYGSRGNNGVIIITTKKAARGLGITVNAGLSLGAIDKSTFAKYQNQYGGGYGAYYSDPTKRFFYSDVNGDGVKDLVDPLTEDASYGAAFNPSLKVYQWDAFDPTNANYGKATPWVAATNGPATFFTHPVTNNQSIFITSADDNGSFKLGYTRNNETGIEPNSDVLKNSINLSASHNITKRLTASGSIDYTRTDGIGRYGSGYQSDNILNSFRQWFQVNNDVQELKSAYFNSGGLNRTWNQTSVTNPAPIYWDNPYFIRYQNYESDNRNRYFGNASLNYKATDWLNLLGRVTVDNWNQLEEERRAVGSVGVSGYTRRNLSWNETNFDFLATADKNLGSDFNIKGVLGTNIRKSTYQTISATTNGGLIVPNVYAISNSVSAPAAPVEQNLRREVDGVFAGATLSWKNMFVLDGTIRRDESSTLPEGNNSYYYPSANAGFIFSELLKNYTWLSYGKLRGGYAQVGNDTNPYNIFDTYNFGTQYGSAATASASTTKFSTDLKPELTKSYEVGAELAFFKNRLGLDATYYTGRTFNQLIPVPVSTSTGYSTIYLNAASVRNKGVEIALNATPIKTRDFSWRVDVNWARNRNQVLGLFSDATGQQATNLQLASYQGGVTYNATLNQPMGTIRGTDYVYTKDANGNMQKTVGADGYYEISNSGNNVIGNVNAKYTGGITNTFKYKDFTLSFLIDVRKGGDIFSLDLYYGMDTGLYPETAGTNDLGNPSRNTIANGGGVVLPGVTANGKVNTLRADNTGSGLYGYEHNPNAAFVYDGGFIKLRQALISYALPKRLLNQIGGVKGVDLSIVGRNLWIIHKNIPYSDPEESLSSGTVQGYQSGSFPTVRAFTFNAKFTF